MFSNYTFENYKSHANKKKENNFSFKSLNFLNEDSCKNSSFTTFIIYVLTVFLLIFFTIIIYKTNKNKAIDSEQDLVMCENCTPIQRIAKLVGIKIKNETYIKDLATVERIASMLLKTYNPYYTDSELSVAIKELRTTQQMHTSTNIDEKQLVSYRNTFNGIYDTKKFFIGVILLILFTFITFILIWIYLKIAFIFYNGYKLENKIKILEIKSLEFRKMMTIICRQLIEPTCQNSSDYVSTH